MLLGQSLEVASVLRFRCHFATRAQVPAEICMREQVKSKLSAARARLEQLHSSNAAAPRERQPQYKPVRSSTGQSQSEAPNHPMEPAQVRSFRPSDLGHNPNQVQKKSKCSIDASNLSSPANAPDRVHTEIIKDEDVQEDFELCVICIEVAPQVRFQPCSHVVTCKPCASKVLVQTGECPMCRGQLSGLELLPV